VRGGLSSRRGLRVLEPDPRSFKLRDRKEGKGIEGAIGRRASKAITRGDGAAREGAGVDKQSDQRADGKRGKGKRVERGRGEKEKGDRRPETA